MKYELRQKIFYMTANKVHSAAVLGRTVVEFVEDMHGADVGIFGDEGTYYQTCHGVYDEAGCFATREELLASL